MISFWRDCTNCDEPWLGSRCQQMFTNAAHELCFLHVVIFQYILNSCPHHGFIVFKGWNSALLCCACSETGTGLFSTLLLLTDCCCTGSGKLGFFNRQSYGMEHPRHWWKIGRRCTIHACSINLEGAPSQDKLSTGWGVLPWMRAGLWSNN